MNDEKEITLGQLFGVVKKSLKRGLIYILVSVIIASAILLSVQGFTGVKCYSANISFATASTELKTNMDSKKSDIVFKALEKSGLSSEIATDVVKNLSIEGIIPDKLEDETTFIPSSYTVKLKKSKELNLTKGQYITLVDNISTEYVNAFAKKPLPTISVNYNVANELEIVEYMQVAIDLYNIAKSACTSISLIDNQVKNYREQETGKTVGDIYAELASDIALINGIEGTIINNKIEKDTNGLKNCIDNAKAEAEAKEAQYQAIIDELKSFNENYSQLPSSVETSTGESMIVINYGGSLYSDILNTITTYSVLLGEAKGQVTKLNGYQIPETPATTEGETFASNKLKEIASKISASISDYTKIANSYNANQNLTSQAKVIKMSKQYIENFISTKIIAITLLAVAVIAYVVAFSKTFSIMKKENTVKAD